MKYKKGDKVVVKVDKVGCNITGNQLLIFDPINDVGLSTDNDLVLGKLEDFQPAKKKIKMTVEEKKEFDELKRTYEELFLAFSDIYDEEYPNLFDHLFDDDDDEKNNKAQLEFARAWEKPSLIEVEEKKYYVHLFKSQEFGYLNQLRDSLELMTSDNSENGKCKTQFAKDEIENLKDLGFKITDDALEEVEDE